MMGLVTELSMFRPDMVGSRLSGFQEDQLFVG